MRLSHGVRCRLALLTASGGRHVPATAAILLLVIL